MGKKKTAPDSTGKCGSGLFSKVGITHQYIEKYVDFFFFCAKVFILYVVEYQVIRGPLLVRGPALGDPRFK